MAMYHSIRITAALAALALAGCGSGDTAETDRADANAEARATNAAASLDPCRLVTPEEMSAITGDKVVEAAREGSTCTWRTDDQGGATIEVDQADAAGKMAIDRKAAGVLDRLGEEAAAEGGGAAADAGAMIAAGGDSPAVGDEAMFGANSQLSLRKGKTYLAITPPLMHSRISFSGNPLISDADKRKMALAIADTALSRIP